MPTYDYQCDNCGYELELFQSITAKPIKKCPECGKNLTPEAKFCSRCGTATEQQAQEVVCGECGSENMAGATFCNQCGQRL